MMGRRPLILVLCALALGAPAESLAEGKAGNQSKRYKFETPDGVPGGAARTTVKANAAATEKAVTDFGDYSSFISKFEKSRIVGKSNGKTDVYLQVPIMRGTAKIWAVIRFEAPKTVADERVVEGKMIKGNVKRLDAKWRIKKVDDQNTQLNLEMVIIPKLPLPDSVVQGETAYASDVAVTGARSRAEQLAKQR